METTEITEIMNNHQLRALWSQALHELADAIGSGPASIPTSMHIWQQYLTPEQLLHQADFSADAPLPIKVLPSGTAEVITPVGKLLGLPIEWHNQVKAPDVTTAHLEAFGQHNRDCLAQAE